MMAEAARLGRDFFAHPTLEVARALLGQRLVRLRDEYRLSGLISETEAYIGEEDQACHARAGRTPRTQIMYASPGHAYVYFTYGIHWCLNFVTEREGFPAAVLIRGIAPVEGVEVMRARRGRPDSILANGPAKLTQALDIDGRLNGLDICDPQALLFVEAAQPAPDEAVRRSPRVGMGDTPEPWRSIAWNFRWKYPQEIFPGG